MTLEQRVLALLNEDFGLTDKEIENILTRQGEVIQDVVHACRSVRKKGLVDRALGWDGQLHNHNLLTTEITTESTTESTERVLWSQEEIAACTQAYFEMLALQTRGQPFVKSHWNQKLREGLLSARSRSSIERRMQNITAVMQDASLPTLEGYAPLSNVGSTNTARILAITAETQGTLPDVVRELPKVQSVPVGSSNPERREVTATIYARDAQVVAWVLQRAGGFCEGCTEPAPFITASGRPFLEVHHVVPLSAEGPDTPENAVALCPNCHRKVHHATQTEIIALRERFAEIFMIKVDRLV